MENTDYIDLSKGLNGFEGLVPSFGKNMGEKYMIGRREGATDYLEVIDCEAVKDYIEKEVETPKYEGQFASFEGFISEKAAGGNEPVPPVPPTPQTNTIFYYYDGTSTESSDTELTSSSYDRAKTLVNVEIGDCVTSIGNEAFSSCTGLDFIVIPNSVTSIGESAFYGCPGLTVVVCRAITPPTLGELAFDGTEDCPILVSSQSVDAYKTSWSEYADRIVGLLNNNQIRYTADEQLTMRSGVDYTEHTFDKHVGIVTFNNDLTTLGDSWFENTFDNYIDNITSLTLPNGVSSIGMSALYNTNTVYYEGAQKECARIDKDWIDGTGVNEYHCFDGIVNNLYNSNMTNPLLLSYATWFKNLIGEKTFKSFVTVIASAKIDENPMTAGEFITILINGTQGYPGLSTCGFTVITTEVEGITIPLAYHTELKHFIGIVKANDYAYIDIEHIVPVAVNESLNPDYMYALFDDTIITTYVSVTIEYENGTSAIISLDANQTYADQGWVGCYSQDTYDSNMGETPEQFSVDNDYPADGVTIYDYCNDTYEPTTDVEVTIEHEDGTSETITLDSNQTYSEQGYGGFYSQTWYNSDEGESAGDFSVENNYPTEGETIYDYCNDIAQEDEPEDPDEPEE